MKIKLHESSTEQSEPGKPRHPLRKLSKSVTNEFFYSSLKCVTSNKSKDAGIISETNIGIDSPTQPNGGEPISPELMKI